MDGQNKNIIFATVLSFFVILTWFFLFPPEELPQNVELSEEINSLSEGNELLPPVINTVPSNNTSTATDSAVYQSAPRIEIDTGKLQGSISLRGGKIDQLSFKTYFETLEKKKNVSLLSSANEDNAYYALFGWTPGSDNLDYDQVPGPSTLWELEKGEKISVGSPVILKWDIIKKEFIERIKF